MGGSDRAAVGAGPGRACVRRGGGGGAPDWL